MVTRELPDFLESDKLREAMRLAGPAVGFAAYAAPFEMEKILDFTGLRGSGSNIYNNLVFQLPKWSYAIKKMDEYIEVSPTWAEYYNITISQKQKLEVSIKQGLTSAAQSVADYELLRHDLRRYKEVLDYFKASETSKDEHVLRSLFVDRVDAHTGEPYSMVSMARRWPTIITDFIRMESSWDDTKVIKEKLDVSMAEAAVLLTKNRLFKEWKILFLPEIKDRVARLQVLVESRRRSIDEYRSWLKPYMARYKAIREKTEAKPAEFMTNPYQTPGFGQSQATTGIKLWFWKPFTPPEKGKPEAVMEEGKRKGFVIDPYDDLVKEWQEKIAKRYEVTITEKDVDEIIKEAVSAKPNPLLEKKVLFYVFFTADLLLGLIRTPPPEGSETDNLMFLPIKAHVFSQNILLVHLIEIWAREKHFEKQINELIGSREAEAEALEKIEKEFKPKKEKRKFFQGPREKTIAAKSKAKPPLSKFFYLFAKKGPYEPIFKERLSKMYARGIGGKWKKIIDFIEEKMEVA